MQFSVGENAVTCIKVSQKEASNLERIVIDKVRVDQGTKEVSKGNALRLINVWMYTI